MPGSASSPRTAPKTASSPSSRSPRTSCSTAPHGEPFVQGGHAAARRPRRRSPTRRSTSSTSAPRASTPHAGRLSGGNQQKVVLARELSRDLRLFVAAQPTRGLDVGSIEFVHTRIVATRDAGIPVIVVSTELDEVVALADRIAVMYRGGIVGIVPGDTPRDVLGLMMAGEVPRRSGGMTDAPTPTAKPSGPTDCRPRPARPAQSPTPAATSILQRDHRRQRRHLGARRRARPGRRRRPDRAHRPGRAGGGRATSSRGPATLFAAIWQVDRRRVLARCSRARSSTSKRDGFVDQIKPLTETLTFATPLIAAGLGVALAFRVGLFNIGGRGQILIAAAVRRLDQLVVPDAVLHPHRWSASSAASSAARSGAASSASSRRAPARTR